jgi:hypothetical protein
LPGAVAPEGFQAIAGRQPQIAQLARAVQLRELPQGHALDLRRQAVVALALPQALGFATGEADNQRRNASPRDMVSSCLRLWPAVAGGAASGSTLYNLHTDSLRGR